MIYHSEKAIFIKIAERLCDDILAGLHQEGDRIPSIRELAAEYEVNTNTVLRAFDILQRDDILLQQRGASLGAGFGASGELYTTRRGLDKSLFNATIFFVLVFVLSILGLLLIPE